MLFRLLVPTQVVHVLFAEICLCFLTNYMNKFFQWSTFESWENIFVKNAYAFIVFCHCYFYRLTLTWSCIQFDLSKCQLVALTACNNIHFFSNIFAKDRVFFWFYSLFWQSSNQVLFPNFSNIHLCTTSFLFLLNGSGYYNSSDKYFFKRGFPVCTFNPTWQRKVGFFVTINSISRKFIRINVLFCANISIFKLNLFFFCKLLRYRC